MSDNTSNECVIEWLRGDKTAAVTMPANTKINNKIKKLALSNKEISLTVNQDGSIFAKIPAEWVKIRPSRQLTEKQRQEAADRMRHYQSKKQQNN